MEIEIEIASAYTGAGVTVVRKYEEQSAIPSRVGKAEASMAI
jgi:hypothetical protein